MRPCCTVICALCLFGSVIRAEPSRIDRLTSSHLLDRFEMAVGPCERHIGEREIELRCTRFDTVVRFRFQNPDGITPQATRAGFVQYCHDLVVKRQGRCLSDAHWPQRGRMWTVAQSATLKSGRYLWDQVAFAGAMVIHASVSSTDRASGEELLGLASWSTRRMTDLW